MPKISLTIKKSCKEILGISFEDFLKNILIITMKLKLFFKIKIMKNGTQKEYGFRLIVTHIGI